MRKPVVTTALAGLAASLLATPVAASDTAGPGAAGPRPVQDEPDYDPTPESLRQHEVPQWFEDAKLGYFVHWGAYSVPAWAPVGNYAEWYWSDLSNPGSATFNRHREVYGEDVPYDAFLDQWRAEKFDPNAWLDLFVEGGAEYFVQVSKHHDGIALWDTDTTDRDTVAHGPRRDFVEELFDAAQDYDLKTGLYYSLPEWFHPAGGWFADGPTNSYTGEPVPYTGYDPVDDYVMDHQYPQMLELVDRFDPDIMWCDIGGANNSNEFMAYYFNQAKNRSEPKDVTVNNRCGNGISDFTTPEYSVEPDIQPAKWEATRGIGHSFGHNAAEDVDDYLTPNELIDSFVDIVSKNGNLLLNVGPKADGTVPDIQAQRVRALGDWLEINGEAIYGATYWTQADDKGANVPVRFTRQPKAFYVTALDWPGDRLVLSADVPIGDRDEITLLGHDRPLKWTRDAEGRLVVSLPRNGKNATTSRDAYTFRIAAPGYRPDKAILLGLDATAPATSAGATVEVTVELANRGDRPAEAGTLRVEPPAQWASEPTVADFPELAPHSRTTISVPVEIPADAAGGDYRLTLNAITGRETFTSEPVIHVVGETTPVDLSAFFDNDGISTAADTTDGDFDTSGYTFPAEELPAPGSIVLDGVDYTFPSGADGLDNNVLTSGQTVDLPEGAFQRLNVLASASYGPAGAEVTVTYTDGTEDRVTLDVEDWVSGSSGPDVAVVSPYRHGPGGVSQLPVAIYHSALRLDPGRTVRSVTLPPGTGPQAQVGLHVFAMTLEE